MKTFKEYYGDNLKQSLLPPGDINSGGHLNKLDGDSFQFEYENLIKQSEKILHSKTENNLVYELHKTEERDNYTLLMVFVYELKNDNKIPIFISKFFSHVIDKLNQKSFNYYSGSLPRTRKDYLNKGIATSAYSYFVECGNILRSNNAQVVETRHLYTKLVEKVSYCYLIDIENIFSEYNFKIIKQVKTKQEAINLYNGKDIPFLHSKNTVQLIYSNKPLE